MKDNILIAVALLLIVVAVAVINGVSAGEVWTSVTDIVMLVAGLFWIQGLLLLLFLRAWLIAGSGSPDTPSHPINQFSGASTLNLFKALLLAFPIVVLSDAMTWETYGLVTAILFTVISVLSVVIGLLHAAYAQRVSVETTAYIRRQAARHSMPVIADDEDDGVTLDETTLKQINDFLTSIRADRA